MKHMCKHRGDKRYYRRVYIREQERIKGMRLNYIRSKWIPIGWYCKFCGFFEDTYLDGEVYYIREKTEAKGIPDWILKGTEALHPL